MTKAQSLLDGCSVSDRDLAPYLHGRSFADCWHEFNQRGYLIFERVMNAEQVAEVRSALRPHIEQELAGRNNFEGRRSQRVYALIDKAPEVFDRLVSHPLPLAFAEAELGRSCLLFALLAIQLNEGETVQPWAPR